MYGTTIRNYNNFSKTTRDDMKNKAFFGKNKKTRKAKKEEFQRTRYMKIEEKTTQKEEAVKSISNETVSKREFPIASVVLTVVATMIILLIGTGVIG
jgi:hypothetical protein